MNEALRSVSNYSNAFEMAHYQHGILLVNETIGLCAVLHAAYEYFVLCVAALTRKAGFDAHDQPQFTVKN